MFAFCFLFFFLTCLHVVFVQLASSAEDVKVQTSLKVGDDSGDHQETKNLNNELDLSSSSSGEAALLPGNGPGTAEAENTTVNGKLFYFLRVV